MSRLRRLGVMWGLWLIPTPLLFVAGLVVEASDSEFALGLTIAGAVGLTVGSWLAWGGGEIVRWRQSQPLHPEGAPRTPPPPGPINGLVTFGLLPWLLVQLYLLPLAWFSATFTIMGSNRWDTGDFIETYAIGTMVYLLCVGVPFTLIGAGRWWLQNRR